MFFIMVAAAALRNLMTFLPIFPLFRLISLSVCYEDHPLNFPVGGWIHNHTVTPDRNADPRGSIRCIGDRPYELNNINLNHPLLPFVNPQIQSALEYCAEPEYGGKLAALWGDELLEGAVCAHFMDPPRVVMSIKFKALANVRQYYKRWRRWHYCHMKCSCIGPPVTAQQARTIAYRNRALTPGPDSADRSGPRNIFILGNTDGMPDAEERAFQLEREFYARHPVPVHYSDEGIGAATNTNNRFDRKSVMSGIIRNQITCRPQLPPWPLPLTRYYNNLHELCAANFLGGHPDTNAAFYCFNPWLNEVVAHPSSANPFLANVEPPIQEEMRKYTEGALDMVARFALHSWCQTNCVCAVPPQRGGILAPFSKTIHGRTYSLNDNGDWTMSSYMKGQPYTTTLIHNGEPKLFYYYDPPRKCRPISPDSPYCIMPPTDEEMDMIIQAFNEMAGFSQEKSLSIIPSAPATCGQECTSARDCSTDSNPIGDCRCTVKRSSIALSQTFDPLDGSAARYVFRATCLAVGLATVVNGHLKGVSGLGGKKRNLQEWSTENAELDLCACNSTYVSAGCCASPMGFVDENPRENILATH